MILASSETGCIGAAFVLILVAVVVTVAYLMLQQQEKVFEKLARRLGGTVNAALGWGVRIEFTVDGTPAELFRESRGSQGHSVRIQFHWTPPGTLRLRPEGLFATLGKVFGSQDIQIGDKVFDDRYIIQGRPESWVRQAVDAEFRKTLEILSELRPGGWVGPNVSLEAGSSGVSVRVDANLATDPEALDRFVDESVKLFRQLREAGSIADGVKILSADECGAQGKCPVCSNEVGESDHRCPTCATRHHAECWRYFGGCATYACGRKSG